MNKILRFIPLFAFTIGCSLNQEQFDRIEPSQKILENENCSNHSKDYYNRFDYVISNYFEFTAIDAKDLDNNGIVDSIAILSPLELLPEFEFCHKKEADYIENRLLLVNLMNADGTILKKFRFDNVISNEPSYPIKKGEEYIDASDERTGFVLFQDFGQGCYVQYYFYINYFYSKKEFILDSLVFKSACPSDTMENIIRHQIESYPFYLKDYNRNILNEPLQKLFK